MLEKLWMEEADALEKLSCGWKRLRSVGKL